MKLNREIQGLRAVAVLSVIITHFQFEWLPGGFVGVDVFFVISGYLITSILVREVQQNGSISFSNFYFRRIRRLLPALLVTCFISVLAGFLFFGDENFDLLINSAISAILSVSNIYFWTQVGYFDVEAAAKPLLHTWSLGVEEQFYLFWPMFILFLMRQKSKFSKLISIITLVLVSYFLNWLFIDVGVGDKLVTQFDLHDGFLDGASTAFYNMPFRIFEFSIGAIIFLYGFDRLKVNSYVSSSVFAVLFVCLIVIMTLLTHKSVFPYYNALWVALVTAGLIVISSGGFLGRLILGNRIMVFIGGLSYSLYLVHWPLIVFYLNLFERLDINGVAVLSVLMLMLAWLLNVFVENKFRCSSQTVNHGKGVGLSSWRALGIVLASTTVFIFSLGNIDGRIPENRAELTNIEWRKLREVEYCSDSVDGFPKHLFTCQKNRNSEHSVVVWGDSHALHLVAGLAELFVDSNIAVAYKTGCVSQSGFQGYIRKSTSDKLISECVERNKDFLDWAKNYNSELIVLISNAKRGDPKKIAMINNQHISEITDHGHKAFVVGDFIRPGIRIAECYAVPNFIVNDEMLNKRCAINEATGKRELKYSKELAKYSISYIPIHESQCPNDICRYFDDNGKTTFRDHHHLSVRGSIYELSRASELIKAHIFR